MCKYITKRSSGAEKIGLTNFKYIDIGKQNFVPKANSRSKHYAGVSKRNTFMLKVYYEIKPFIYIPSYFLKLN